MKTNKNIWIISTIIIICSLNVLGALSDGTVFNVELNNNNVTDSIYGLNGTDTGSTNVTGKMIDGRSFIGSPTLKYTPIPNSFNNTENFTYNSWVYVPSATSDNCQGLDQIVGIGNASGQFVEFLVVRGSGSCTAGSNKYIYFSTNAGATLTTSSTLYSYDTWFMFTVKRVGTQFQLFIDGNNLENVTRTGGNPILASTGTIQFGQRIAAAHDSTIRIDSASLWNRTLTNAEILSLYASGSGFPYPFSVPESAPTIVTINSPLNNTYTFNSTQPFNVSCGGFAYNATAIIYVNNTNVASVVLNNTNPYVLAISPQSLFYEYNVSLSCNNSAGSANTSIYKMYFANTTVPTGGTGSCQTNIGGAYFQPLTC